MAWNKLSTYKTKISKVGDVLYSVTYHDTAIVQCYDESGRKVIELNTGGETGNWHTSSLAVGSVTTKKKLNQASRQFNLGYSVHQHKHKWYVTTKAGEFLWDDDSVFVIDAETGAPWGVFALFTNQEKAA